MTRERALSFARLAMSENIFFKTFKSVKEAAVHIYNGDENLSDQEVTGRLKEAKANGELIGWL